MLCAAFHSASVDTRQVYHLIFRMMVALGYMEDISRCTAHTYTHWDTEGKPIPVYSLTLSVGEAVVKVISVSSLIFALPQELRSIK